MNELIKNADFLNTWNFFNAYLLEAHGIILTEAKKNEQLNMLAALSRNDVEMAIEILEINISNGNTIIIKPSIDEFV